MGRGPGATRRFNGLTYGLTEAFTQGATEGVMTYEQRNQEASFRAKMLRNAGFNVRVVNGAGWTALYTQKPQQMRPLPPRRKPKETMPPPIIPKIESPTDLNQIKTSLPPLKPDKPEEDDLEWLKTKFSFADILGLPKPKPKDIPNEKTKTTIAKMQIGLSRMMQDKEKYFEKNGMGYVFPQVKINPKSKVTGFGVLDRKESDALIKTMTLEEGQAAFKTWMVHAGGNREAEWTKEGDRYEETKELFEILTGRKTFEKAKKAEGLFVIEVDDKPAFFSPANSVYAQEVHRLFRKDESKSKTKKKGTMADFDAMINSPEGQAALAKRKQEREGA